MMLKSETEIYFFHFKTKTNMMLFFSMLESKLKNELKTCGIIFLKFKNIQSRNQKLYNLQQKKINLTNKKTG